MIRFRIMPMLPARHYESEYTKFMRELMDRRGELTEEHLFTQAEALRYE